MSGAIAIFVKTPGLSPVKTRLAKNLGQTLAESFHLAAACAVASVVQELRQQLNIQAYYAVAEKAALQHDDWQDFPCIWQGEGGLGERMAHIYQHLLAKHDFVLLVGADIPQMTVTELYKAGTWLANKQARLIFGPSLDGGFWVFGANCSLPTKAWTQVRYSEADTGTQFLNKVVGFGELKRLDELRDVDEVSDLLPLRDALIHLTHPLPKQGELIHFLDKLSVHFS